MRYFKKTSPKTKVMLSNGQWLQFEDVDGSWGIYPPEGKGISTWLGGEIAACIKAGRGGVVEIDMAEHQALLQKKSMKPSRPQWREEISKPGMLATASAPQLHQPRNDAVVDDPTVLKNPSPDAPKTLDKPRVARRRRDT